MTKQENTPDTPVELSFRADGRPLRDILRSYFIRLKQETA